MPLSNTLRRNVLQILVMQKVTAKKSFNSTGLETSSRAGARRNSAPPSPLHLGIDVPVEGSSKLPQAWAHQNQLQSTKKEKQAEAISVTIDDAYNQ
jgi:hypothetical protein